MTNTIFVTCEQNCLNNLPPFTYLIVNSINFASFSTSLTCTLTKIGDLRHLLTTIRFFVRMLKKKNGVDWFIVIKRQQYLGCLGVDSSNTMVDNVP